MAWPRRVGSILAYNGICQFVSKMAHGLPDALPGVPPFVAVTQFDGFFFSRRRSRRNGRNTDRTTIEPDFGLECRIAARVEDLAAHNVYDFRRL